MRKIACLTTLLIACGPAFAGSKVISIQCVCSKYTQTEEGYGVEAISGVGSTLGVNEDAYNELIPGANTSQTSIEAWQDFDERYGIFTNPDRLKSFKEKFCRARLYSGRFGCRVVIDGRKLFDGR